VWKDVRKEEEKEGKEETAAPVAIEQSRMKVPSR
jgi:hypothetical protein